jgi:hypothetical protein
VAKPGVKVRAIIGKHQAGRSNEDVTAMEFSCARLLYVPQGIDMFFRSLSSLEIENCGLKTISRDDLFGLESLKTLLIRSNKLR